MNLKWLRRGNANKNNKGLPHTNTYNSTEEKNKNIEQDIENQNSNMSFNDEEYVKALTNEQVEDCKEAFAIFVDHDGYVDISNLGAILRALGEKITDDEVEILADKYDHMHFERGGKLNYEQFIEFIVPRIIESSDTYNKVNVDKLFKDFDQDGDGYITATELRQSLKKLGSNFASVAAELTDEDVEEIIIECDEDGDGRISYSEFTGMLPYLNEITEDD